MLATLLYKRPGYRGFQYMPLALHNAHPNHTFHELLSVKAHDILDLAAPTHTRRSER